MGHSFSKKFFNGKFEEERIYAEYRNFEIPGIAGFNELLDIKGISGFNVTIPYKQEIMPLLDSIDPVAEEIGAVNVVKIIRKGGQITTKGYNSDIVGFRNSLLPMLRSGHKNALILGTGGASKAVVYALKELDIGHTSVSRTKKPGVLTYSELDEETIRRNTVIVNTTPVGMFPHTGECPDIPYRAITPGHICYDLIYNPEETLFLKRASDNGAATKNGMEMLVLQALESWRIWNINE